MSIKLSKEIAEKYKPAKKVSQVFISIKLGGIKIDLSKIKMDMADKLAALEPPLLLPKSASKKTSKK